MTDTSLRFLSKAWLEKNGMFEVIITQRGGMELVHAGFLRRYQIPKSEVIGEEGNDREFRSCFENFLPAHLAEDFKQCTIYYYDNLGGDLYDSEEQKKALSSINFDHWITDNGQKRKIFSIVKNGVARLCLPPMKNHVVPIGTVRISFNFEWIGSTMSLTKYSADAQVIKDLRTLFGSDLRRTHPSIKKVRYR